MASEIGVFGVSPRRSNFARRVRLLTHILIMSAALNSIFFILFFYFLLKTTPFISHYEYQAPNEEPLSAKKFDNLEILKNLSLKTHLELRECLNDDELIEDGYKVKDLALALLVRRDHFDLARALGKRGVTLRWITAGERKLALFPDLTEDDFKKITAFYESEKWPLTQKGLFIAVKKRGNDVTLLQACTQTPAYLTTQLLFRGVKGVKKKWLVTLLSEGKWDYIEKFVAEQKARLDVTPERRLKFLLGLVQQGSPTAASLLLLTDFTPCLKRLDDTSICLLLDKLPMNSKRGELFAKKLLAAPRGSKVHERAKKRLLKEGHSPQDAKGSTCITS